MKWSLQHHLKEAAALEVQVSSLRTNPSEDFADLSRTPIRESESSIKSAWKRRKIDDNSKIRSKDLKNPEKRRLQSSNTDSLDATRAVGKCVSQHHYRRRKIHNVVSDKTRELMMMIQHQGIPSGSRSSDNGSYKIAALSMQLQKAMIADEDGDRAIHIAVAQEDAPLVIKLCFLMKKAGLSLDVTNHLRQTPLHLAIIVGNNKIVRILLQNGASLDVKDRRGSNSIQLAVRFFEQETFSFIMAKSNSPGLLNSTDYDGFTALHYAVSSRNFEAADGLCEAGADVNAVDGKSGRTPLLHAVIAGYTEMVNLLLRHGANPEKVDYSGWSALELALQSGNRTLMRVFEITESSEKNFIANINESVDFPDVTSLKSGSTETLSERTSNSENLLSN